MLELQGWISKGREEMKSLFWFIMIVSLFAEYYSVWNHNSFGIFVFGLIALTNAFIIIEDVK